ncbi:MAG: hypothetical protein MAG451_01650 [Anaerolineales bacterium]|nr:hypothetical protein [Anaerolineales bacterium]
MSADREDGRPGRLRPGWRTLTAAGLAGLLVLWWRRRQRQTSEPERQSGSPHATFVSYETSTRRAASEPASDTLPATLPECCINVLGRPGWYDRELLREVQIKPANTFVKLISSERVAGTDITATTIGDTIYFRKPEGFDPHSPAGLALLAHEIRHVEQYREQGGIIGFALNYVREYRHGGYGIDISFEAEAYEIGAAVQAHLTEEFEYNEGVSHCRMTPAGEHRPNLVYAYAEPYPDLPRQA